jgi:DNA/RNA-binding domain of Phe-tRNA-synthetase-like protein
MLLKLNPVLQSKFPGLHATIVYIKGVKVEVEDARLEAFKSDVFRRIKARWSIDDLREHPIFRAYRDFFWKVGIDPTKTRPAAEALIRRVLRDSPIPRINTLVDAYNLASVETSIPFAAFDLGSLLGEPVMREATAGEEFLGIGMDKPLVLGGGEPVIQDEEKLIAVYPHRDAEASKVTLETGDVLLLTCGVSGVDEETLRKAKAVAVSHITRFCGGNAG